MANYYGKSVPLELLENMTKLKNDLLLHEMVKEYWDNLRKEREEEEVDRVLDALEGKRKKFDTSNVKYGTATVDWTQATNDAYGTIRQTFTISGKP